MAENISLTAYLLRHKENPYGYLVSKNNIVLDKIKPPKAICRIVTTDTAGQYNSGAIIVVIEGLNGKRSKKYAELYAKRISENIPDGLTQRRFQILPR